MSFFLVRLSALLFSTATSASRAMMTSEGREREDRGECESNLALFPDSPEKHYETRTDTEAIGHSTY